jgi:hypothetical protein
VALSPQDADTTKHSVNSKNIVMHSIIRLVRLSSLVFMLATTGCANFKSIHRESEFSKHNGGAVFNGGLEIMSRRVQAVKWEWHSVSVQVAIVVVIGIWLLGLTVAPKGNPRKGVMA